MKPEISTISLSDTIGPMPILTEIHRCEGVDIHGRTIHRKAVRAVIARGNNLLMIYSSAVGDYKFPGGGVDQGESHEQALRREVQEECGMSLASVGDEIGSVLEFDQPVEKEFDAFRMVSHYYRCDVLDGAGSQKLDDYEKDLGFTPIWINIDQAIQANEQLLDSDVPPEWLKREIFVLKYLKQTLFAKRRKPCLNSRR
ncbi:MAG: NUDIX domain-containing protein [Anaerolineales bacterium]